MEQIMGVAQWILSSAALQKKIRETLKSAGVPFSEEVPVDGYQADFVFQTTDGSKHVIEAKDWEPTRPDLARAKKLASDLKTLSVEGGYVVLPSVQAEQLSQGIISVRGLDT